MPNSMITEFREKLVWYNLCISFLIFFNNNKQSIIVIEY